ncbi:MAG: DUF2119 family protein [Candidatus Methanoperedens sp.]|nr:DUF2119 family protein [Candidatus Methanoperedens sp.]
MRDEMFFKVLGSSNPTRLFVAGIHGDEEAITRPIFEMMIKDIKIISGRLVVVSLSRDCPYISTLNEAYYDSTNGKKLLELIQEYRPGIYVELHTYKIDNHSNLIDPDRRKKIGVPPFTELEEKVLIGSVSPLIRTSKFRREDFCFTLEMPDPHSEKALKIALHILRSISLSSSRGEILEKLREQYPLQIQEVEKNFREFFKDMRNISFF